MASGHGDPWSPLMLILSKYPSDLKRENQRLNSVTSPLHFGRVTASLLDTAGWETCFVMSVMSCHAELDAVPLRSVVLREGIYLLMDSL